MKTNPFANWSDKLHSRISNKFEDWFGYPAWPRTKLGLEAKEIVELNKRQTATRWFRFLKAITDSPNKVDYIWTYRIKEPIYKVKCKLWYKWHLVDTGLSPTQYWDTPSLLLHANFELLVKFIELEHPWGKDGLNDDEFNKLASTDSEYYQYNAERRKDLVNAYNYWKTDRPRMLKEQDDLSDAHQVDKPTDIMEYFAREMTDKDKEYIKKSTDMEKQVDDLDIYYMTLIVKHHKYLWA